MAVLGFSQGSHTANSVILLSETGLPSRCWARSPAPLSMNHHANKKSAAESMLDVALLMANASQLKAVAVGVLLIFTVRWNLNDEQRHWRLNIMENLTTCLVFIIVVVNIFITAFGVHRPKQSN
ncbi:hypothetical protein F7725_000903 [Dissostichus mawsoni]|uniref:Ninjurin 1 n=1 Tax=Dissostichus mawsoni TaxID=36200 RepID=A0A7J5ZJX8_DISMA|nr:hypothetical protein F7725_000903 [Dissostichus mawsoni]